MQWFRMYAEAVDDDKLRLLAFEDRWHFVALLCLKAGGVLDSDPPTLERRVAIKLGLMAADLAEVKRRLREVGLIDDDWQPAAWGKRQFESDHTGALRSRRWRKKTKRHGDITETSPQRRSDGPEQNRTDTEQNRGGAGEIARSARAPSRETSDQEKPPDGLDLTAWNRFAAYRRETRKPIKPASVLAAQRKLAGFGASQTAVVEQSIANGWQGLFALKDGPKPKEGARNGLPVLNG